MKKLFSLMLAMLMLLTPVMGLAEEAAQTTVLEMSNTMLQDALEAGLRAETVVTFEKIMDGMSTGDESVDAVIRDVFDAVKITAYQQGDEAGFALYMQDTELLNVAFAASGEDAYVSSNLLGGTIVIAPDEVVGQIERLIDMFVMMGAMTEDEAAEIKAMLPALYDEVKATIEKQLAAQAELENMELNLSALDAIIAEITEGAVEEAVTGQARNYDLATKKMTVTVTPDQMTRLVQALVQVVKDNPALKNYIEMEMAGMELTYNDQPATFDEILDGLAKDVAANDAAEQDLVLVLYFNDAEELVALSTELADETNTMTVNYTRLTTGEGQTHTVVIQDTETTMTVNVLVNDARFMLGFDMADAEMTIHMAVDMKVTASDAAYAVSGQVDLDVNDGYDDIQIDVPFDSVTTKIGKDVVEETRISLVFAGMKLGTMVLKTTTVEPEASIMEGNVQRLAELSDEEFANWFVSVYQNLMGVVGTAVSALPESALMMVMGQ